MTIVIVTPFFNEKLNNTQTKTHSCLTYLAEELSKYKKVVIISSRVEGARDIEIINKRLKILRFKPTFYFPKIPYVLDLFLFFRLYKLCKILNCEVIIGNSLQYFSCFVAAITSKLGNHPFICRIIGESSTSGNIFIDIISRIYDLIFSRITIKIANKIFIPSNKLVKRPVNLGSPKNKIFVVEFGIDISRFNENKKINYLRKEYGLDDSKIIVLFASRLYKLKGIEDLIAVAEDITSSHKNVIFLIAGTGPLELKLKKITKENKNIIFTGYRSDIENFMVLSDIFVQASYSEGLSPAIMQACSCGSAIVATKVGGTPDLIKDGFNGFLVKPGDLLNLKSKIITLINNNSLRRYMSENNKKMIRQNFDIKLNTKKFLREILN